MNTARGINNKAISDKYTYYQKTKVYKKKKPTKTKIKVKNTTIVIFYLTALALYIISFFTLRLVHIKNNNNILNQINTSDGNIFTLINNNVNNSINNNINTSIENFTVNGDKKYLNLNGFMSQEIKFGFNYMTIIINYKIIDKENKNNIKVKKISDIDEIQGDNDCYILNGSSKLIIKYSDIINQNKLNIKNITNQFMDNFYEKIIINIFTYIDKKLFNNLDFDGEKSECLKLTAKQININTSNCNSQELGIINNLFNNSSINKKVINIEDIKTNIYNNIHDNIHSFFNKFIKGIEDKDDCSDGEYYLDFKETIDELLRNVEEDFLKIINYIKIARLSIISLLIIIIILKLVQIKTSSRIVSIFYHIISYASLLIFLAISITLFIPKKVLSLHNKTKEFIDNLKFVNNLENLLMFIGSMILLTIKIMELVL